LNTKRRQLGLYLRAIPMLFSKSLTRILNRLTRLSKRSPAINVPRSSARFEIELLGNKHYKKDFQCEEESLTRFLLSFAKQHSKIDFSKTYVAVYPGDTQVLGYYTILPSQLKLEVIPNTKGYPTGYQMIPAIKLARLARDITMKGTTVGETLLMSVFQNAVAVADKTGAMVLELDAKNEHVRDKFYARFNFIKLLDDELHLYLPMSVIRNIVAQGSEMAK